MIRMFSYQTIIFLFFVLDLRFSLRSEPIGNIVESMEEHGVVPDVIDVAPTELLEVCIKLFPCAILLNIALIS